MKVIWMYHNFALKLNVDVRMWGNPPLLRTWQVL